MSVARRPELGTKPVSLTIKLPAPKTSSHEEMAEGLRQLYQQGEFTDVTLVCANQTFHAHRVVLAAESDVFRTGLAQSAGVQKQEIRMSDIANPEAVKFMLDHFYQTDASVWGDYNPRTQEINKDVLRLAQQFRLPGLVDRATHWLAKGITTGNVVERLQICDDFGLHLLREKILEQLTMNRTALSEVANSEQILKYPTLMQAMLQQTASVPTESPTKKRRK